MRRSISIFGGSQVTLPPPPPLLRCSDHALEVEKGRHKGTTRTERICAVCGNGQIEDEEHFLFKCNMYNSLKEKFKIDQLKILPDFFNYINHDTLYTFKIILPISKSVICLSVLYKSFIRDYRYCNADVHHVVKF